MTPVTEGPTAESALILSGPDDSIFDVILDWIANSTATITRNIAGMLSDLVGDIVNPVTEWISWLWDTIQDWLYWVRDQIWSRVDYLRDLVSSWIEDLRIWISSALSALTTNIRTWLSDIPGQLSELGDNLETLVYNIGQDISSGYRSLQIQITATLDSSMAWLAEFVTGKIDALRADVKDMVPAWIQEPGQWIQELLSGAGDWLVEDIPGHSPRWHGIARDIWDHFQSLFWRPAEIGKLPLGEQFNYSASKVFNFMGDSFNTVLTGFMESVQGFARSLGPMSPENAVDNFTSLARVGSTALAGLAGMTLAGSWLKPLGGAGMGNIAAMIYDMTSYKAITGVFMSALTIAMLRQPLTYHFNNLFRPWILSQGDFTELLSRNAFRDPGTLRNPELIESMKVMAPNGGADFEARLMGFYGYPPEYLGLFRELANTRLGYFALAGVARTGFYDQDWFEEALARTGYSETARRELLKMYREQVKQTRIGPVMPYLRKLYREGFIAIERVQETLVKAEATADLDSSRFSAMDLEREYERKTTALDISLRAFSRGIIPESEARSNLSGILVDGQILDNHILREKLGLIRRINWSPPEDQRSFSIVEE